MKIKVLAVDDNAAQRSLLEKYFNGSEKIEIVGCATNGEEAVKLYDTFNEKLREQIEVETGVFGAEMKVSLLNDGPVTIILEK